MVDAASKAANSSFPKDVSWRNECELEVLHPITSGYLWVLSLKMLPDAVLAPSSWKVGNIFSELLEGKRGFECRYAFVMGIADGGLKPVPSSIFTRLHQSFAPYLSGCDRPLWSMSWQIKDVVGNTVSWNLLLEKPAPCWGKDFRFPK